MSDATRKRDTVWTFREGQMEKIATRRTILLQSWPRHKPRHCSLTLFRIWLPKNYNSEFFSLLHHFFGDASCKPPGTLMLWIPSYLTSRITLFVTLFPNKPQGNPVQKFTESRWETDTTRKVMRGCEIEMFSLESFWESCGKKPSLRRWYWCKVQKMQCRHFLRLEWEATPR